MVQRTRRSLNMTLSAFALFGGLAAVPPSRAERLPDSAGSEGRLGLRDPGAEQFVQANAQRLISILDDPSLDEAQKAAAYRGVFEQVTDLPKVSSFVLGRYSAKLSVEQRERFTAALVGYACRVSMIWLKRYRRDFRVKGSRISAPGDVIVETEISGDRLSAPIDVTMRVVGGGADRRIIDLQYRGAWLRVVRRDEFVSTLDRANGDVEVLIARLNELPKS
jgi:phospholipid transport system substrate-binding protein